MSTTKSWPSTFSAHGQVRYYSLARYAMIEALSLAGVGNGSCVLLPEFLCRDMLAPLHLLGARVCWYPVASNLQAATNPADWPKADVVLAVNYFGFPQDLESFRIYEARTGALIIEDNAHGYLSRDQTGNLLGCRTGLGLFSFRKTLRIPDGGALWVDESFSNFKLSPQLPFDGIGINPAQLIKARLRALPVFGELVYRLAINTVRRLRKLQAESESPLVNTDTENIIHELPNPWVGLLPAIGNCDEFIEVGRRRVAYAQCVKVGERFGALPVFLNLPEHCAPYAYAFRGGASVQDNMRRYAKAHGFDFVSWPDLPVEIIHRAPEHYKNIFLVNFLW